jgi:hypothetical protein
VANEDFGFDVAGIFSVLAMEPAVKAYRRTAAREFKGDGAPKTKANSSEFSGINNFLR